MRISKTSGFTLIEMIVTISILALLAGAATPRLFKVVQKGRVTRAQADCDAIVKAIILYNMENGHYPGGAQNDPTYNFQRPNEAGFSVLSAELVSGAEKYLSKDIGLDPWGNEYCYHIYTRSNPYQDVIAYSMGPNGTSQSWSSVLWNTGEFADDDIGAMHDQ